jgi:hypothetical protein
MPPFSALVKLLATGYTSWPEMTDMIYSTSFVNGPEGVKWELRLIYF